MSTKKNITTSTLKKIASTPVQKKKTVKSVIIKKSVVAKKTKTSIKKASEKISVKKVIAKKVAKKKLPLVKTNSRNETEMLVCAPDGHCFWTTDGSVLRDLQDLRVALGSMDETVFMYHANDDKNDFADWVEYVLGDAVCAAALRQCTSVAKASSAIQKRLNYYSS